ncbi:hypothetical protein [Arsenophonus nasoniae]
MGCGGFFYAVSNHLSQGQHQPAKGKASLWLANASTMNRNDFRYC